jgi:peroxiredoxin
MKNRIILGSVALLSLIIASCADKDAFHINGTLEHPGAIKKVYLLAADSSQVSVVDSVNLSEDGKFQFKRPSLYANLFKLRIGANIFDLIAQNGDAISFKTDEADSTHTYTITGSQESEKIQEFNKITNTYGANTEKIVAEYQAKLAQIGHQSDSLMAVYRPMFMKSQDEMNKAVYKFVTENQKSLAAFYAATSLDTYKYEKELVAYADAIKDNFKGNAAVDQFVKQMMLVKPISVGHQAPEFTTMDLTGKPVKLSDYKGKYVMLDYWASWCGPCRAEMPNVVKQYAAYKDKGLNILGISLDDDKDAWKKGIADLKMTWAQVSDLKKFDGPTEKLYHIEAIPANFIIDPQGNIIAKNLSGTDLEEFLKKTFNKGQ